MLSPKLISLAFIAVSSSSIEARRPSGQPGFPLSRATGAWPVQRYRSCPAVNPILAISGESDDLSPGYVFFDSFIMTTKNELVFAANDTTAVNFHVQSYHGKDYITYWKPNATGGIGYGYGSLVMMDSDYVSTTLCIDLGLTSYPVSPRPICQFDFHEQMITHRNTLLVIGYNYTTTDLTTIGGPKDGHILNSHFFEIDIQTQKILFAWDSLSHVPVSTSHQPFSTGPNTTASAIAPYDYFHINSLELVGDNYLVNSRNTWSTFLISGTDGSILWTFNATGGGSFGPANATSPFSWQHFARAHNVTDRSLAISYFANNNDVTNLTTPSTGLVYELALPPSKKVAPKLLRSLSVPSEELYAASQGSYQTNIGSGSGGSGRSGSRNQFIGYGQVPVMREFSPAADGSSELRWEARFNHDGGASSYRAYKQEWHGTPRDWDPSLVVVEGNTGGKEGWVSWNGATDGRVWRVRIGEREGIMEVVETVPVVGHETRFEVPGEHKGCVQVEAVMERGMRKSNVVCK